MFSSEEAANQVINDLHGNQDGGDTPENDSDLSDEPTEKEESSDEDSDDNELESTTNVKSNSKNRV